MKKVILLIVVSIICFNIPSFGENTGKIKRSSGHKQQTKHLSLKTWGDSLFVYATEAYLPPSSYNWNWRDAVILRAAADLYRHDKEKKEFALRYIKECVENTVKKAHAKHPNGVASAFALPFLYKETGEQQYMDKALELYAQYRNIPRAVNGGVSHRADPTVVELWDDTVYMIALFLLEMYQVTGDEKYLQEFIFQLFAHSEKLADPVSGFWYHGWDNDNFSTRDGCCQEGWSDNPNRRNNEFWGRGNGWIAMALADCLEVMPQKDPQFQRVKKLFTQMMYSLLPLQDEISGHWRQLPVHIDDKDSGNYIESSGTVMFGYSIAKGISIGVLPDYLFRPVLDKAYYGVEKYSIVSEGKKYKTIQNVCAGTCIGDKSYYYAREVVRDTEFAVGGALLFDTIYRQQFLANKD